MHLRIDIFNLSKQKHVMLKQFSYQTYLKGRLGAYVFLEIGSFFV